MKTCVRAIKIKRWALLLSNRPTQSGSHLKCIMINNELQRSCESSRDILFFISWNFATGYLLASLILISHLIDSEKKEKKKRKKKHERTHTDQRVNTRFRKTWPFSTFQFSFSPAPATGSFHYISTDNVVVVVVSARGGRFVTSAVKIRGRWVSVTRREERRRAVSPWKRRRPWQSWPLRGVVDVDERNYHRCILVRVPPRHPLSPITRRWWFVVVVVVVVVVAVDGCWLAFVEIPNRQLYRYETWTSSKLEVNDEKRDR